MPKANNTSLFRLDNKVTLNDYLFGTDSDAKYGNKNYYIKDIYDLFKKADNQDITSYFFYEFSESESYKNTDGFFNSNSLSFSDATEISVNNKNSYGRENGLFFDFIKQYKSEFLLKFNIIGNPNVINFFEIEDVADVLVNGELKGYSFTVDALKDMQLGAFENGKSYAVSIELKNEIIETTDDETSISTETVPSSFALSKAATTINNKLT